MRLPTPTVLTAALGFHAFAGHGLDTRSGAQTPVRVCEVDPLKYTLLQQCPRDPDGVPGTNTSGTAAEKGTKAFGALHGASDEDPEELATSSFMSFEEWKAMMLQKTGQDPAALKEERKRREGRGRADLGPNVILDRWGDDGEIALDLDALSGIQADMTSTAGARSGGPSGEAYHAGEIVPAVQDKGLASYRRPKDAGKTCKERFSYASFDGGATILKTSAGAQNPKAILVENKDAYMLFTCSQENKFVIVELSEDILVDTVVLANFEFFSSTIRSFRVSVSDKYPVHMDKWKDVGTYQARNSRDIQSFLIENPKIYAKYIRIEFLSHYGREYYCPVSLLRVHGTRMLDSWKDVENAASDEDEPVETIYSPEAVAESESPRDNIASEPDATAAAGHTSQSQANNSTMEYNISPRYAPLYYEPRLETCAISTPTMTTKAETELRDNATNLDAVPDETFSSSKDVQTITTAAGAPVPSMAPVALPMDTSSSPADKTASNRSSETTESPASISDASGNKTRVAEKVAKASVTPPGKTPPGPRSEGSPSKPTPKQAANNVYRNASGTATAAAASSTIQESFFKSITKRITYLEGNVTLSLQYIEEQSKFLQDALQKMERRQIKRVDDFLHNLNKTVLGDIVLTLDRHRAVMDRHDRQILALSSQMSLLAGDVGLLKLMMIVLIVLNVCGLLLLLLSRGAAGSAAGPVEQWATAGGHFFSTYIGTPLSARSTGGTATPTQPPPLLLRRQSAGPGPVGMRHTPTTNATKNNTGCSSSSSSSSSSSRSSSSSNGAAARSLHPRDGERRSVSGPPPPPPAAAAMDKVLPLTPTPTQRAARLPQIRVDGPAGLTAEHNAVGGRSSCSSSSSSSSRKKKKTKPLVAEPSMTDAAASALVNGLEAAATAAAPAAAAPAPAPATAEEEGAGGGGGVEQQQQQQKQQHSGTAPAAEACEEGGGGEARRQPSPLTGTSRKPLPALPEDPT